MNDRGVLCPSAIGKPGAKLIGISSGPETLGYVTPPLTVGEDFLAAVGENPERNFRFASRCHEGGCHNWGDNHCEFIHQILSVRPGDDPQHQLPVCGIRSSCKWFAQAGRAACHVCPVVLNPGAAGRPPLRNPLENPAGPSPAVSMAMPASEQ